MTTSTAAPTQFATSADGTSIAYEVRGTGPALVNVDGAMCSRQMGPSKGLAEALADRFTVYTYDRRDRGDSGAGASPYAVQREVEDLLAVLAATGGRAHVLGSSSGAALALEAARQGAAIERLAVYEAPFIVDDTHPANDPQLGTRTQQLVDSGHSADAVRLFLRTVGMPGPMVAAMRFLPPWKHMVGMAPTLPHDYAIVLDRQQGRPLPAGYYDGVAPETLVMAGGKSPAYMQNSQAAIAAALPHARLQTLPGQTHLIKPKVVAAAITPFLLG